MVVKQELLDQALDGQTLDPLAVIRAPRIVPETTPVFRVLGHFKQNPIRLAAVLDEYGTLQGIVTQTDLLEAIAGELPDVEAGEPDIVEHDDGSLPIDGLMPAHDAFDGLGIRVQPDRGFHTIARFALMQLAHLQEAEETFAYKSWCFEIIDMDGTRIDKLLARRQPGTGTAGG